VDTDHDEKITLIEFEEIFKLVPDALPAELVRLFGQDSGFMPREVTVFHVFKKGKRVKVPNPKRQTLFGTLPERAARKVDEVLELELKTSKAHKMQMSLAAKMIADAEARSLCWSARLDQNVDQCSLKGSPSGTSPSGRSSRNSPSYSPSKRRAFNQRASSSSGGRSTASETSCRDTIHSSCRDTTPAYLQCTPRGDTPPDVWLAPCELSAAAAAEAASGTTVNVHAKLEAKCCSPAERAPCSSSSSFVAPGACQQSRVHALPSHTAEGQKAKDHITVRV